MLREAENCFQLVGNLLEGFEGLAGNSHVWPQGWMCLESRSDPPLLSQMHFQRQAVERVLQVDTGGELCSP